jgi:hypothetical protein
VFLVSLLAAGHYEERIRMQRPTVAFSPGEFYLEKQKSKEVSPEQLFLKAADAFKQRKDSFVRQKRQEKREKKVYKAFLERDLQNITLPCGADGKTRRSLTEHLVKKSGRLMERNAPYLLRYSKYPPDPKETVVFGSYPQSSEKKEPIEWLVLAEMGSRKFVISKYILECRVFDEKHVPVRWKDCSLRKWLNEDFYNEAFNEYEKSRICPCDVKDFVHDPRTSSHSTTHTIGATDRVFILYSAEVDTFFYWNKCCEGTKHAKEQKLYVNNVTGYSSWWIRGMGVTSDMVSFNGMILNNLVYPDTDTLGVRPAMWISAPPDMPN